MEEIQAILNGKTQMIPNSKEKHENNAKIAVFKRQGATYYDILMSIPKQQQNTNNLFICICIDVSASQRWNRYTEIQLMDIVKQMIPQKKQNRKLMVDFFSHEYTNGILET